MKTETLTVPQSQIDRGDAVSGPRYVAQARFEERHTVLWLRASGKATLFYREDGKARQTTWARFTITQNPIQ